MAIACYRPNENIFVPPYPQHDCTINVIYQRIMRHVIDTMRVFSDKKGKRIPVRKWSADQWDAFASTGLDTEGQRAILQTLYDELDSAESWTQEEVALYEKIVSFLEGRT